MRPARTWETSLGAIEIAVGDCLKALDKYEGAFRTAYGERSEVPALRIHVPDEGADETWSRHLDDAERSADGVEDLLREQELIWRRWQELMARWRQSLEQSPVMEPEIAHAFLRGHPAGGRTV